MNSYNPDFMRSVESVLNAPITTIVPQQTATQRGVFMGYRDVPVQRRPTATEIALGKNKAPVKNEVMKNQPEFADPERVALRWYEDAALRNRFSFSEWRQLVNISADLAKYQIYQTPFDVANTLSAGAGAGTAPVLTQADAAASTQDVYRQTLGRDASAAELATGSRKMRSTVAGGNSMNAAGEAVLQDIRKTDEFQAELGDDVLDALVNRISRVNARTR